MIDKFKKFFAGHSAQPALAETQEEVDMTNPAQANTPVVTQTAEMSDLVAQLASQSESLSAAEQAFAELTTKFELAQAALAEIETAKASLIAQAVEAKLSARKEKVEATLGTEKTAAVLAATDSLEDAQFETILSAFAASMDKEAESAMFKEAGVAAAEPVAEKTVVTRLQDNLAAQFKIKE